MIRINLLPVKRKKKAQPLPPFFIQGAIILGVIILVLGILTFHLGGKVSDMKNEKAAKEQKLVKLKEQLKEVENYERDNEAYKEKNKIIERLKKNQNVPLRLLDEVSARLPKGVWLTALTDKSGDIDIKGYAFTNSDLVSYVQNLKGSKYLTDVELLESRKATLGDVSTYQFRLTFRIKV